MQNARPLTPKQQRFVDEYLLDLNATQAAIRAGYSPKTATEQGSRLFRSVQVQAAIKAHGAQVSERAGLTLEAHLKRLNELADLASAAKQFGPAVGAEISRGKASGFYVEKREHSGTVRVVVERDPA